MSRTITLDDLNALDLALHKAKALLSVTASAVMYEDPPTEKEVYNTCWIAIDLLEEAGKAAGLTS